jgi:hypothetical protein
VFIVGLSKEIKKSAIESYFKNFGDIEEIRIIQDKMAQTSRGNFTNFKFKRIWICAISFSKRNAWSVEIGRIARNRRQEGNQLI